VRLGKRDVPPPSLLSSNASFAHYPVSNAFIPIGDLLGAEVPAELSQALEASLDLQQGWVYQSPRIAEYQKRLYSSQDTHIDVCLKFSCMPLDRAGETHGILTSTSHIRSEWILILRLDNRLIMFRFMILWPAIDLVVRLPLEFPRSTTSRKELFHLGIKDCMSAFETLRGCQLTIDPVPSAIHQRGSSIINHFTSFFNSHLGSLFSHPLGVADLFEGIIFDFEILVISSTSVPSGLGSLLHLL
jgi:hypothetical protein